MATDRHTDRQTHRQTDRQTHRRHAKNTFFGFSGPQNVNIHQNMEVDFLGECNTFSILRIAEKVKMMLVLTAVISKLCREIQFIFSLIVIISCSVFLHK